MGPSLHLCFLKLNEWTSCLSGPHICDISREKSSQKTCVFCLTAAVVAVFDLSGWLFYGNVYLPWYGFSETCKMIEGPEADECKAALRSEEKKTFLTAGGALTLCLDCVLTYRAPEVCLAQEALRALQDSSWVRLLVTETIIMFWPWVRFTSLSCL